MRAMTADLTHELKRTFGFDAFRPGQEAVVRHVLAGRDVLALMPTGGGKSLCYQLPALLQPGVSLVVSPLIALMQDQVRQLQDNGVAATFINSSLETAEISRRTAALLRGDYKLVYLAPERLVMPEFLDGPLRRLGAGPGINAFVIDEAHCVSEWGHDFRPEYRQLSALRRRHAHTPILAFTATATPRVRSDIIAQLALREPAVHLTSFNRPNLFYESCLRPSTPWRNSWRKREKAAPESSTACRDAGSMNSPRSWMRQAFAFAPITRASMRRRAATTKRRSFATMCK